jgi:hypothetical protein
MRKQKYLGEPGRCQPAHHGRSQFLNGEHINVMLPQNAKKYGRSATPPLAFTVNRCNLIVAAADQVRRDGHDAAWLRARLSGGSCHVTSSAAGIASRAASHQAAYAAMTTAATAGTTVSGARAASFGPGFGGYLPASRASSAGNAKVMRIKAVAQVTPCLFSPAVGG